MDNDYPASHSMDTCFFAVDRDGHVAVFDTGEAGAVPAAVLSGEQAYEARRQFAQLPRVGVIHEREGRVTPNQPSEFNQHRGMLALPYPTLVFLDSLDPVKEEIAAGRGIEVQASEGVAVLFQELSEALAKRLHDSGACRGCSLYFSNEDEEFRPDLAARGFFSYSHLTENWISGPYGRVCRPAQPIHVDQLPPRMREAVKSMRFESLSFAETTHIQPIEHTECVSWESAYMDVTGKNIRPIPGREDEYTEHYEELADIGDNMNVEPPPGHNADAVEE
ncbi:MAG TPA: hypothetical protein VE999_05640 [Gemmataceae bacterium]|nr:hypothetical protein [Gemmataceae bacterium]